MPELPEVETVRRQMADMLTGKQVSHVTLNRANLRWPIPAELGASLTGKRFTRFDRHGKYILACLDDTDILGVHLGMTGAFRFYLPQDTVTADKHDHVVFGLHDGGSLIFNDPRRFGALFLTSHNSWRDHPMLANKGRDPINEGLEAKWLQERLQKKSAPIKTVLLDQGIITGLGNIYVVEALFIAGIHPDRPANSLKASETAKLAPAIVAVLQHAINLKGTTIRNYQHLDGGVGKFQDEFKVYDRRGEKCLRCNNSQTIAHAVHGGRSTYYCVGCQK